MRDPCEHCGMREAEFIAVSKDYTRMAAICKDCYPFYAEARSWFFAPSSPNLRRETEDAIARSA